MAQDYCEECGTMAHLCICKPEPVDNWVKDKQENGDDGSGYCDDCDGCSKCVVFCGDCLTPLENCGCRV